jgi:hypothetical protein
MANEVEQIGVERWADECMASLEAGEWQPDIEARLRQAQHNARVRRQRRRTSAWTAVSVAAACLIVLSFPSARTRAQLLFQRVALRGIQIVGLRPDLYSAFLFEWTIRPAPAHLVSGPDAAGREAGFTPVLPDWTMVSQPVPSFGIGVMGGGAGTYEVSVSDLRSALKQGGSVDIEVPGSWNGARIGIEISPRIYLNARGFFLIQSLPDHITMPEGFAFERFVEALLRIGGLPQEQSRVIAQRVGSNPTAILGIPPDSEIETREVQLLSGTGVLIENTTGKAMPAGCVLCPGFREVVLAWQTPERNYVMKTALNEATAIAVANSLR